VRAAQTGAEKEAASGSLLAARSFSLRKMREIIAGLFYSLPEKTGIEH
jgi:hypothetical protein